MQAILPKVHPSVNEWFQFLYQDGRDRLFDGFICATPLFLKEYIFERIQFPR